MRLAVFYAVFEVIVFSVNPFCEIAVPLCEKKYTDRPICLSDTPLYWMHLIFSYTMVAVVLAAVIKKDEADAQRIPGTV